LFVLVLQGLHTPLVLVEMLQVLPPPSLNDIVMDIAPWSTSSSRSSSKSSLLTPQTCRPVIDKPALPVFPRFSSCKMDLDSEKDTKESEIWPSKFRLTRSLARVPKIRSTPNELWQLVSERLSSKPSAGGGGGLLFGLEADNKLLLERVVSHEPDLDISENEFPVLIPYKRRRPLQSCCSDDESATPKCVLIRRIKENWQKNPHAPRVMSKFNPLREQAPFQYWREIEMATHRRWNFQKDWFPKLRSRFHCDPYSKNMKPQHYLLGPCRHCLDCQKDPLGKKLLIHRYRQRRAAEESNAADGMIIDIHPDTDWPMFEPPIPDSPRLCDMSDDLEMPASPILRDLDDFDCDDDMF